VTKTGELLNGPLPPLDPRIEEQAVKNRKTALIENFEETVRVYCNKKLVDGLDFRFVVGRPVLARILRQLHNKLPSVLGRIISENEFRSLKQQVVNLLEPYCAQSARPKWLNSDPDYPPPD
jgi:hypothetical protein